MTDRGRNGEGRGKAIVYALLAAVFYALNIPLSSRLLAHVSEAYMAAFLYLGAGLGIALWSCVRKERAEERLSRADLPYVLGMIFLDIFAPIFLMLGLRSGSAAHASLLSNFEIVATTVIALLFFREKVSPRLWAAIALITLSCILLSFEGEESLKVSSGSLFVLLATLCWGLENNCTRMLSGKSAYQIVTVKGIGSGLGALGIALLSGAQPPEGAYILPAMLLGFVAYGLSIFLYVRSQHILGAARTSAYYAVTPFVGCILSFLFLRERVSAQFLRAFPVMVLGVVLVVRDTLHATD
ncbi:MAG: DMT family transporter [Clostridia bacterium]|nr:DMT family transporter [Clostridia bacterium]